MRMSERQGLHPQLSGEQKPQPILEGQLPARDDDTATAVCRTRRHTKVLIVFRHDAVCPAEKDGLHDGFPSRMNASFFGRCRRLICHSAREAVERSGKGR